MGLIWIYGLTGLICGYIGYWVLYMNIWYIGLTCGYIGYIGLIYGYMGYIMQGINAFICAKGVYYAYKFLVSTLYRIFFKKLIAM